MLPSWHSFEEYNLCVKGHVQQRLLRSCSQYLFCVYGRHYTNTKKNTRVESTTYSGLCLIQMLLCTLHSADVRVELIKDEYFALLSFFNTLRVLSYFAWQKGEETVCMLPWACINLQGVLTLILMVVYLFLLLVFNFDISQNILRLPQ